MTRDVCDYSVCCCRRRRRRRRQTQDSVFSTSASVKKRVFWGNSVPYAYC
jgi:hypothetical protein